MNKKDITTRIEKQFALDYCCSTDDFSRTDSIVTVWEPREGARKQEEDRTFFSMLSYKGKLVITCDPEIKDWCENVLIKHISAQWGFEIGSLISIDRKLKEYDFQLDKAHLYFIQEYDEIHYDDKKKRNDIKIQVLSMDDIGKYEEDDRIDEAFLFEDYVDDVMGVALSDVNGELKAIAGATNNGDYMWQMGINSFDEGHGYASKAIRRLILEANRQGIIPYYDTALSHIGSQKVALKAGMIPAFCEVRAIKR